MNIALKRATILSMTILLSGLLLLSIPAAHAKKNNNFTVRSVKGCYVSSLLGTVAYPTDPTNQIPMTSFVRFCPDGKGNAELVATHNIGGSCSVEQSGNAEYDVAKTGIGLVTATLDNDTFSGGCTIPISNQGVFKLQFGIQRDNCLQVTGTGLELGGETYPVVLQGVACPQ